MMETQLVRAQRGRPTTPLSDRNVILDEILQLKKEMRILSMENRRTADEMEHRLGVVDGRLQVRCNNFPTSHTAVFAVRIHIFRFHSCHDVQESYVGICCVCVMCTKIVSSHFYFPWSRLERAI
jgi:hypothetical protein